MAGGLWKRIKTWGLTEVVQNSDLNKEFDNVRNNFIPQMMASYSQSITQSNIQTAPGVTGSEVLASALSGDIENIKYQLNQIIGDSGGLWRAKPSQSLSSLNTLAIPGGIPQNRIVSGRMRTNSLQPTHLVPAGNAATATIKATTTNLVMVINNVSYTLAVDTVTPALSLAPGSNNTATINDSAADGSSYISKNFGDWRADFEGSGTSAGVLNDYDLTVSSMGSNISALIGSYAAFSYVHGAGTKEYFMGYVQSATQIRKCFRGFFFDSSDAPIVSQIMTTGDTISLMKLAWIYLKNDGTVLVSYSNPRYSAEAPVTPAPSAGDFWYDTLNQNWNQYNGGIWSNQSCHLVGITVQDGTNCVAARSFEAFRTYSDQGSVSISRYSNTEIRGKFLGNKINVYGQILNFEKDLLRWVTPDHLDSGVSISASTTYFLYITDQGKSRISNVAPQRRYDLLGLYHPSQSWRCFGMIYSDGSSNFDAYKICALGQLSGDMLFDRSVSVSKQAFKRIAASAPIDGIGKTNNTGVGVNSAAYVDAVDGGAIAITCTVVCTGRPIWVGLNPTSNTDGAAEIALSSANTTSLAKIEILRGGVAIGIFPVVITATNATATVLKIPCNAVWMWDFVAPGTYTYTMKVKTDGSSTINIVGPALLAFEI